MPAARTLSSALAATALLLAAGCSPLPVTRGDDGPPALRRADIGNASLAYVEQGRGETVVFVHGAAGDWRTWEPLRPYIAARYRFVSYSRRYHHPNAADGGGLPYTARQQADDLVAFVRTLGPGPVHAVGASAGGRVLAEAALQQPGLFKSLTLSEPLITRPVDAEGQARSAATLQEFVGTVLAAARAGDGRAATVRLVDWVYGEAGAFGRLPADRQQRFLDNQGTLVPSLTAPPAPPPTCEQLRTLPMPVLVMQGEKSRAGFRASTEGLLRCLSRGVGPFDVPGAGHVWYPVEPRSGAERIMSFIASAG
jgi:pimeloyl-ACP methyl ester carboxylesterase